MLLKVYLYYSHNILENNIRLYFIIYYIIINVSHYSENNIISDYVVDSSDSISSILVYQWLDISNTNIFYEFYTFIAAIIIIIKIRYRKFKKRT
jgi:hypothetical protein